MNKPPGRLVAEFRCGLEHLLTERPYLGSVTERSGDFFWHGVRPKRDRAMRYSKKHGEWSEEIGDAVKFRSGPVYVQPDQVVLLVNDGAVATDASALEVGCRDHGTFLIPVTEALVAAHTGAIAPHQTVLVDDRYRAPR